MKTIIPIFPSEDQCALFQHWQNNTRWLWNECIGKMNEQYQLTGSILRKSTFSELLSTLITNVTWLNNTPYTAYEWVINELDAEIQKSIDQQAPLPTFKRKKKERNLINIQLCDTITVNNEAISFANVSSIKCVKSKFIKKVCPIRVTAINGEWTIELGKSNSLS